MSREMRRARAQSRAPATPASPRLHRARRGSAADPKPRPPPSRDGSPGFPRPPGRLGFLRSPDSRRSGSRDPSPPRPPADGAAAVTDRAGGNRPSGAPAVRPSSSRRRARFQAAPSDRAGRAGGAPPSRSPKHSAPGDRLDAAPRSERRGSLRNARDPARIDSRRPCPPRAGGARRSAGCAARAGRPVPGPRRGSGGAPSPHAGRRPETSPPARSPGAPPATAAAASATSAAASVRGLYWSSGRILPMNSGLAFSSSSQ